MITFELKGVHYVSLTMQNLRGRLLGMMGLSCVLMGGGMALAAPAEDSFSRYTIERIPKDLKVEDNIVYKIVDGQQLKLTLFVPTVKKYAKAPLLIYIHGGGWGKGNRFALLKSGVIDVVRQMNDAGVVCAAIEYRLANGGKSTVLDAAADCKDAVHYFVKNAATNGIDPDRIATIGGSAGGHLSLVTALGDDDNYPCDPDLAKYHGKIVAEAAYFPLVSMVDPTVLKGSNFENPARFIPILGGPLEQKRDVAEKLSPTLLLKPTSPAILLAQGDHDHTLNVVNSITMANDCKAKGVPYELIVVKNADHGFAGTNIDPPLPEISRRTSAFLLQYLLPGAK